jgi:hypothetical protein
MDTYDAVTPIGRVRVRLVATVVRSSSENSESLRTSKKALAMSFESRMSFRVVPPFPAVVNAALFRE